MNDNEMIVVQLASAVIHLQEHINTGEAFDFAAAESNLAHPLVEKWMSDNKVLLPLRRDGR